MQKYIMSSRKTSKLKKMLLFYNIFIRSLHYSTALSSHCLQRQSGLAQWQHTTNVTRRTKFWSSTKLSCGLRLPLRQTASYV